MAGAVVSEGFEVDLGLFEFPLFPPSCFLAVNKVNEGRFCVGFKTIFDDSSIIF